jgi:hypothetical protein
VLVDGRTVTIASYLVRTGELITLGETAARMPTVQEELAGDAAIQDLGARVAHPARPCPRTSQPWLAERGRLHGGVGQDAALVAPDGCRAPCTLIFLVFATPLAECSRRDAARRDSLRSAGVRPSAIGQQAGRQAHVLAITIPRRCRAAASSSYGLRMPSASALISRRDSGTRAKPARLSLLQAAARASYRGW